MQLKVFLNGEFVNGKDAAISVFDHGVLYGDGVFEGIRSYKRRVFRLKDHLDRLYSGARAIRLRIPMTKESFQEKIIETLRVNGLDNAYVRAVVTRGIGDLGLDPRKCKAPTVFIITDKIDLYPEVFYESGLSIAIAKTRRNPACSLNPRIKSLNYLNNILGKIDAIDAGTEEAIMLSIEGYVTECTGDNIFIVRDGKLMTPPCDLGSLEGITQKAVIELALKRDISTEYKEMLPEELCQAEECFLTGTAAEVIPVVKIDEKAIGTGKPGRITKQLRRDFGKLTETDGVEY
ncbi:MAG: branched-chain-amino-acid transaminase [Candidatus Makaraimicrobium thalassicum]|nr:MAG: branched-chain-amino-acid transaminase [Candidatus Omnitrophota bacterium]